jgi:hypothetical protein
MNLSNTLLKIANVGIVRPPGRRYALWYYRSGERIHPTTINHLLSNYYIQLAFSRYDFEYYEISNWGTRKFLKGKSE